MKGKVCVITGATSGIGKAAAMQFATLGADLVLVGRNVAAGNALLKKLDRGRKRGEFTFVPTDLSNQNEVRSLANAIRARVSSVDVLVNNAGARFDRYAETGDRIEKTFATNHLSHFLLTNLILDLLGKLSGARVITIGSGSHVTAKLDQGWLLTEENYDRKVAYANSKLANIMFAYELARRTAGTAIVSNAIDPGGVATNLGRNNGLFRWLSHIGYYALKRQLTSATKAAEDVVYLGSATALDGISGKYYFRKRSIESSPASEDLRMSAALWELSAELTKFNG